MKRRLSDGTVIDIPVPEIIAETLRIQQRDSRAIKNEAIRNVVRIRNEAIDVILEEFLDNPRILELRDRMATERGKIK